jgi:hypothetical protein
MDRSIFYLYYNIVAAEEGIAPTFSEVEVDFIVRMMNHQAEDLY